MKVRKFLIPISILFAALVYFSITFIWNMWVLIPSYRTGILISLKNGDTVSFRNETIKGNLLCGEVSIRSNTSGETGFKRYISTDTANTIDGDGQTTLGNTDKSLEDVIEEFDWRLGERKAVINSIESQQNPGVASELLSRVPDQQAINSWRFNRLWRKHCQA